jgi:hypothetical protein
VSALSRDETGLFDRLAAAAIEDRDALGIGGFDPTGIDEHPQLADFAAGMSGDSENWS